MIKFVKKLSKNDKIIISSFSPTKLGFQQVEGKEEFENYSAYLILKNLLFIQTKTPTTEKEIVRNLINEGFSTFHFIGKGLRVNENSTAKGYIITDHINMSGKNPLRGVNNEKYGVRFPDMSGTYSQLFNEEMITALNINKAKLFIPKNIDQLSKIENEVIQKNQQIQILSNEIYSGVITAKHAGCKSCAIMLVESVNISSLFE